MAADAVVQIVLDVESFLASAKIDRTSVATTCEILTTPGASWCHNCCSWIAAYFAYPREPAIDVILEHGNDLGAVQNSICAARDRRVGRVRASGNMHDAVRISNPRWLSFVSMPLDSH
jgi:hypothetical protein